MEEVNEVVSIIEQALQLKLKAQEEGETSIENTYCCNKDGKITELCLSDVHFENFDALRPVFNTLKEFTLIDCSVAYAQLFLDLNYLKRLTLNNTEFRESNSSINPSGKQHSLYYLTLSNLDAIDFNALASIICRINQLAIINSTLDDVKALFTIDFINDLTLDNVTLNNTSSASEQPAEIHQNHFKHVSLINMDIEHPCLLLPIAYSLEYLRFDNCNVSNHYEINLLPDLYSIRIVASQFHQTPKSIAHKRVNSTRDCIFLHLENMRLDDFDIFLPISEKTEILGLDHCTIGSLQILSKFPELRRLDIDAETVVESLEIPTDLGTTSFQLEQCVIEPNNRSQYGPITPKLEPFFDLKKLASIAPCIKGLKFIRYQQANTDFLKHFTQLSTLEFENTEVNLDQYLPVAHQIQRLNFIDSEANQREVLKQFKQLEYIEAFAYHNDDDDILMDLKELLPLKHNLKHIDIHDSDLLSLELLKEFTALEEIDSTINSIELAEHVLKFKALKKLDLSISDISPSLEKPVVFDLKALGNVESLTLSTDDLISFTGMQHLKSLKSLDLYFDCNLDGLGELKKLEFLSIPDDVNVNEVPRIESLSRLQLWMDESYEVHSLAQFPNLEYLEIQAPAGQVINIGVLKKLSVLRLQELDAKHTSCFTNLPNLEILTVDLVDATSIENFDKLSSLKYLNVEYSSLESIEGLAELKMLEHLNLAGNELSDITILNKLPNLKLVNLYNTKLSEKDVEQQLENPEIAGWLHDQGEWHSSMGFVEYIDYLTFKHYL